MSNSWQILPSPRPLLIWLGADAVCVALLTLLALALLAMWRSPARPWRLGLASLVAGWLGVILTSRIYNAYRYIARLADSCAVPNNCSINDVQTITQTVTMFVAFSVVMAIVTLALLFAATIFSALERGRQTESLGVDAVGDDGWKERMARLAL